MLYMCDMVKFVFQQKCIWTIPHLGGSPVSTKPPNFMKISWLGAEIYPQKKFKTDPLAVKLYVWFQFWQLLSFEDLPLYRCTKFEDNLQTHGWVIVIKPFLCIPLNWHCKRHSAVMQAIYKQLYTSRTLTYRHQQVRQADSQPWAWEIHTNSAGKNSPSTGYDTRTFSCLYTNPINSAGWRVMSWMPNPPHLPGSECEWVGS